MRISDWSSDVCSSDLVAFHRLLGRRRVEPVGPPALIERAVLEDGFVVEQDRGLTLHLARPDRNLAHREIGVDAVTRGASDARARLDLAFVLRAARIVRRPVALLFARIVIAPRDQQIGLASCRESMYHDI